MNQRPEHTPAGSGPAPTTCQEPRELDLGEIPAKLRAEADRVAAIEVAGYDVDCRGCRNAQIRHRNYHHIVQTTVAAAEAATATVHHLRDGVISYLHRHHNAEVDALAKRGTHLSRETANIALIHYLSAWTEQWAQDLVVEATAGLTREVQRLRQHLSDQVNRTDKLAPGEKQIFDRREAEEQRTARERTETLIDDLRQAIWTLLEGYTRHLPEAPVLPRPLPYYLGKRQPPQPAAKPAPAGERGNHPHRPGHRPHPPHPTNPGPGGPAQRPENTPRGERPR